MHTNTHPYALTLQTLIFEPVFPYLPFISRKKGNEEGKKTIIHLISAS